MFESVVVVPIHIYINVYIRVFSSLGILCDFISLALVINCFSIFLFFFIPRGSVVPEEGIIFRYYYSNVYFPSGLLLFSFTRN